MSSTGVNAIPYPDLDTPASPDVPADMQALAAAIDRKLVTPFASAAARNAAVTSPVDGEGLYYLEDVDQLTARVGGAWVQVVLDVAAWRDPATGTAGLRTLGTGSQQAAAGNHTHTLVAVTDAGNAAGKNTGTTTGTVATGDHTHPGSAAPIVARKATATARTSTTTLAADGLAVTLTTGTWRITLLLGYNAPTNADLQWDWTFTGTVSDVARGAIAQANSTSGGAPVTFTQWMTGLSGTGAAGGTASDAYAHEVGTIVVTAGGSLSLRWAPQSNVASATTVLAGSTVIADQIL